jgi:hypothetical protein
MSCHVEYSRLINKSPYAPPFTKWGKDQYHSDYLFPLCKRGIEVDFANFESKARIIGFSEDDVCRMPKISHLTTIKFVPAPLPGM